MAFVINSKWESQTYKLKEITNTNLFSSLSTVQIPFKNIKKSVCSSKSRKTEDSYLMIYLLIKKEANELQDLKLIRKDEMTQCLEETAIISQI